MAEQTDLVEMLDRAAARPLAPIDPAGIRRRVDGRRRRRTGVLAVAVIALLLLPLAYLLPGRNTGVVFDGAPDEDGQPVPVAGDPAVVDLEFDATMLAMDGQLRVSVVAEQAWPAVVGSPAQAFVEVVVVNEGDVTLVVDGMSEGLQQQIGAPTELQLAYTSFGTADVVATSSGGPPEGAGERTLAQNELPPGIPRTLHVEMLIPEVGPVGSSVSNMIPLPGDILELTVRSVPQRDPVPAPPDPVDLTGVVLDRPAAGEAMPVLVDGVPLWIADTEAHGVTVVDARTLFEPYGQGPALLTWCPSTEAFFEHPGGSRFSAAGEYGFGPSPRGLTTYSGEPTDDGRWRLTGASPAGPRPAQLVGTSEDGRAFLYTPELASGPWCDVGSPETPEPIYWTHPTVVASTLPGLPDGRSSVDGAAITSPGGVVELCPADAVDPWTCGGPTFAGTPQTGVVQNAGRVRVEGTFLVSTEGGAITEIWVQRATDWRAEDVGQPNWGLGIWGGVTDASGQVCRAITCTVGTAQFGDVELLGPDGPVDLEDWDGVLPDTWVLLDQGRGVAFFGVSVTGESEIDPGLVEGDLVRWRQVDRLVVERLELPDR